MKFIDIVKEQCVAYVYILIGSNTLRYIIDFFGRQHTTKPIVESITSYPLIFIGVSSLTRYFTQKIQGTETAEEPFDN